MTRLWPTPVGHLRAFLGISAIFLAGYFASNFSDIWTTPRLSAPMFGSLAQFLLPFGVALGVFQSLVARGNGLAPLFQGSALRALPWTAITTAKVCGLAIALVLFNGAAVILTNVVGGVAPQLPLLYLAYPVAFLLLGSAAGVLLGPLCAFAFRPERIVTAYLLSFAIGIAVFLLVVVGGGASVSSANSLALGAAVVEPFEEVRTTLLLSQVVAVTAAGIAMLLLAVAVHRPLKLVRAPVLLMAVGLVALAGAALNARSDVASVTVARDQADAICTSSGVRICAWNDGERGLEQLAAVAAAQPAVVGSEYFPESIVQEGVDGWDAPGAVSVARMPDDPEQASAYLAELVLVGAGCSDEQIGTSDELRQTYSDLIATFDDGVEASVDDLVGLQVCE